ncbi:MAG: peroxidase family protein [Bacteroidota bacterium]
MNTSFFTSSVHISILFVLVVLCPFQGFSQQSPAKYGRLFPELKDENHESHAFELGELNGPMDEQNEAQKTNSVPLGMVFLGQYIDHDLAHDFSSDFHRQNSPDSITNFATPYFDLEGLYAKGPERFSELYKEDGIRLLTGKDEPFYSKERESLKKFDILRDSRGIGILGSALNDENVVVSQLHLKFIEFHNAIADVLEYELSSYLADAPLTEMENFIQKNGLSVSARRVTQWHYQWIIIHEFLPMIIGEPMARELLIHGRQFYKPETLPPYLPVEFSAAAYRFGHSIVSDRLYLQDPQYVYDLFGRNLGSGFTALGDSARIVQWDHFFALNSTPVQLANKVDTKIVSSLLNLPFRIVRDSVNSLATRNLMRGESFNLPSGQQVRERLGISDTINSKVDEFLNKDEFKELPPEFSTHTPLWFYILAESEIIGRMDKNGSKPGEGLGPTGARIVGEVMIGLIEEDPNSYLNQMKNWKPFLGKNGDFTVKDLIQFTNQKVSN